MTKKSNDRFIHYLREYFTVYLPKQRNCSPHTITACRQTWNMLLGYVCKVSVKPGESLSFSDFNRGTVMGFLDEMEQSKGWAPSTRNQRLACIRSFFRFAACLEPILAIHLEGLNGIPLKKTTNKSHVMEFMTSEAMAAVLRQPDASTKMGIRDMFFMVLMYDSAARDCEMLGMRLCDFDAGKRTVYLMGKGSKPRLVPINEDTVRHFHRYEKLFHPNPDAASLMFYTIRHRKKSPMSDDNVARFIRKYGESAKAACPEVPGRIHPHMFRRSRAMHLYRSGMPQALLAEWLGHENLETVFIYAYADTEMKRNAIEEADGGPSIRPSAEERIWEGRNDLIERLCGLR
jgi:site-specific recombinase XerD